MFDAHGKELQHLSAQAFGAMLETEIGSERSEVAISALMQRQKGFLASGQTLDLNWRRKQLLILRDLVQSHEASILEALHADLGKSSTEAYMTEVGVILSEIRETLKQLKSWMQAETRRSPLAFFPARSQVRREPYGQCLIMSPWNYPLQLNLAPTIAALAAGNVAVLKPSELAPQLAGVLRKMISQGFPPEVLTVMEGDASLSTLLLSKRWDLIFFTGSTAIGRIVASAAAKHLTPCILELGGKSPCIVSRKANINLAARRIVWGKFINAGQTCVAPDYILAEEEVYDQLLAALRSEIRLRFGEHPLLNPELPKIVNDRHFQRLIALIDPAKIAEGGQYQSEQRKIAPTLLSKVSFEDSIMREEIFGPLLPLIPIKNLAVAQDLIREHEKPLALYLFSEDEAEQEMIARNISYGGGCMNDVLLHTGNGCLPFGGVGESGMGAYHGRDGFEAFSHRKGILYSSTRFDPPFRYRPWTSWKNKAFRLLLR